MNKVSDVKAGPVASAYADINIPYNVISRFDYIVQLPADLDRLIKTLKQTSTQGRKLSSYDEDEQVIPWQRPLKRIVAFMRTYWREVEIPADVDAYITDQVLKEFGLNGSGNQTLSNRVIQANIQRVNRSVYKFVKALACVDHQPAAKKEIVDRAMVYVRDKIKFLEVFPQDDETDR